MSAATVLVVDDDEDIRDAIVFILRGAGYEPLEAADGQEALDCIAARGLPQLILLDMNMPGMNGWEFVREAHARGLANARIVVITAAHDAQRSAEEIGALGFLGKPFELEDLVRIVRRTIDAVPIDALQLRRRS